MLVYWPGWFCESGDRPVAVGHGGVQRVDEWGGLPHWGWGKDYTIIIFLYTFHFSIIRRKLQF